MALVTKRMRPLRVGNKVVYQVGIPVHWHYAGGTGKGKAAQMANLLTPYIGDAHHGDTGVQGVPRQRRESLGGRT